MPMNWNAAIRQTHRWLSIAFTLAVIANIVLLVMNSSQTWVGVAALVPLIPLLATGLYMFVLPYLGRR
jgi:membrane protein CcdC involved in cytochrome C biogenesis